MGLQDKFRLFGALRAGADGLFAVLMFIFVLAGAAVSSPALASPIPAASYGAYEQADLSETSVPRSAVQRASQPSECVERHDSCGLGAIATAHAEPFSLGLTRHVSFVTPRAPEQVPVPDVAPPLAASLSILFRNFRE